MKGKKLEEKIEATENEEAKNEEEWKVEELEKKKQKKRRVWSKKTGKETKMAGRREIKSSLTLFFIRNNLRIKASWHDSRILWAFQTITPERRKMFTKYKAFTKR